MAVKMFSKASKRIIIDNYINGESSVKQIAQQCCCSETTIKRVLEEAGVFTPVRKTKSAGYEQKQIMAICYRHKIDSQRLEALINEPSLTPDNVVKFLRQSNPRQLAIILIAAGLATQLPTLPIPKDAQLRLIE